MPNQNRNDVEWNAAIFIVLILFYILILACFLASILDAGNFLREVGANKFRTFFEILSFVSTAFLVPGAAFWAISFARKQAAEAERSRLASVYLELTKRWVDADLTSSRRLLQQAKQKFRTARNQDFSGQVITDTVNDDLASYIGYCLVKLRGSDLSKFGEYVKILTFFEDLGVLCRQGYVSEDVILDFIGLTVIEIVELTADYIRTSRRRHSSDGKVDEAVYANLIWLYREAKKFEQVQIYTEGDVVLAHRPVQT
jgi:hypothetical protein